MKCCTPVRSRYAGVSASLLMLLTFNAGAAAPSAEQAVIPKTGIAWSKKMQELYKTLTNLLTDVTSDRRYQDPANHARIIGEAHQLASLAHDLGKKGMVSLDQDPTIPIVADLLSKEARRAETELKRDNWTYARGVLRNLPSYCITCHTRNSTGPQFSMLAFEPTGKNLTPLERGEFFAATRQFERAQAEFLQVIRDQKAAGAFNFVWERAIQQSLAITVRVKQDWSQALEVVQAVLDVKGAPISVQEDAKAWKASILEWKNEKPRQSVTEEGLYAEALRLLARARETQKYPIDRNADVLFLRASAAVHDLLQAAPHGPHAGDALLFAGVCYEVLSPLKLEDLHELYYQACVREVPHTPIADACYRRYEQSVFFGYTGSAGTDIPGDVRERLIELKSLAAPAASKTL